MISELRGRVPADVCHQEPSFSLRGPAKAPTPTSAEGASFPLLLPLLLLKTFVIVDINSDVDDTEKLRFFSSFARIITYRSVIVCVSSTDLFRALLDKLSNSALND